MADRQIAATDRAAAQSASGADSGADSGASTDSVIEIATSRGPARAHLYRAAGHTRGEGPGAERARGLVVLGHGAGGGIDSADLQSMRALCQVGWSVALVEQPWRVAGRRVAGPPAHLDEGWVEVVGQIHDSGALVLGGRSAGARVACRTASTLGADAVLALAFPLHPPRRPEKSRGHELLAPLHADRPTLVVQGRRDPFGTPAEVRAAVGTEPGPLSVLEVAGDHAATRDLDLVTSTTISWLDGLR